MLAYHVRTEPVKVCNTLMLSPSEKLLFAAEALLAGTWQSQINLQLFDPLLSNKERVW